MATTSYTLSKGQNSSGESQITLRTYVRHGYCIRIPSGICVNPKRWGKKNSITIPVTPGDEQDELLRKKELLRKFTAWIEDEVLMIEDKSAIDSKWGEKKARHFYKPVKATKEREKSFFDVIETYLVAHKLSDLRINNFRVLARCLQRFELIKKKEGRGFKMTFANISPEVLRQIEYFLADEPAMFLKHPDIYVRIPYSAKVTAKTPNRKRPPVLDKDGNVVPKGMPKPRGQNTISDMLTRFRAFFLWSIDNVYTQNNPFKHYVIGEIVYGTPIYISNEERNKLLETDMSDDEELELHSDIFVFQSLIGCRISHLYKMTRKSIINGAVEYIPRKTRDGRPITVRVPLNETGKRLIAKYHSPDRDLLFPFGTEQHYNRQIKEAFRRAGLDRTVTVLDQQTRQEQYLPLYEIASSHMTLHKLSDFDHIPEGCFIVVSISMLDKFKRHLHRLMKMRNQKIALIFDESDEITNPNSMRTMAVLDAFRRVKYKALATGTTTRNYIVELYPQLELLYNNSVDMMCMCGTYYYQDRESKEIESDSNPYYQMPFPAYRGHILFKKCFCPGKASVLTSLRSFSSSRLGIVSKLSLLSLAASVRHRETESGCLQQGSPVRHHIQDHYHAQVQGVCGREVRHPHPFGRAARRGARGTARYYGGVLSNL